VALSGGPSGRMSRSRASCACASASGLARVPMRRTSDCMARIPRLYRPRRSYRGNGKAATAAVMASRGTTFLGIETSCDETAAAVVARLPDGSASIRSDVVFSQVAEHAAYGGVVPEIAARAHVERLDELIRAALDEAGTDLAGIDAVAVTAGPGLVGGLIVGLMTGKAIAAACGKPLYCINHLEGHALTARLTHALAFP